MNDIIELHNKEVSEFAERQNLAEEAIRKHFLGECQTDFAQKQKKRDDAQKAFDDLTRKLSEENSKIHTLRQVVRTHGPAALKINKLVESYLGHGELTVHVVEGGYEIHRHGAIIEGLPSEGEKTAIAIAYFLSTIASDGRKLKDMIIVVDDPVSSLDSKALNFACNLIKGRLSSSSQLIVLTHNQQCLQEFRKDWKSKAMSDKGKDPTATLLFIDVRVTKDSVKRSASLVPMPKLLREYDSEYHFLFNYVCRFMDTRDADFSSIGEWS